ncbi:hypothetical protein TBLA_0J01670 [Henningerozyma blattae CBS 6284]|uniref:Small ribosomal subunit protein uS5m n=1 Tax=Henningerozyma blattae (strain ATCC 34711 / CBS 6284 / DSM 70876 / NBRC 10599 / NRRL Y-10934 / UCD 77-7) TaxID=1071380 RepID=I2H9V9_HENB6|nr:hypothetical protein TBLA_0J01670 [Tetrapisispora blattae CBS 6284]CCH63161.1 hypothetical protein TBLA_0J01670 [Tetrapisispora blattae CBS 6284]
MKRCFSTLSRRLQHYDESLLSKYYSSDLIQSIKLAQDVIPPNTSLTTHSSFAPTYLDDFSKLHPYWDYKPGTPHLHSGTSTLTNTDSLDWTTHLHQQLPDGGHVYPPGTSTTSNTGTGTPTLSGPNSEFANALAKQTGLDPLFIKNKLTMKPLVLKRVSNQTAKGKIASFYSLVAVGDRKGMIGLGEGKSRTDMAKAVYKSHWDAVRNLTFVPRYENRTIYNNINHRFHGVKLFLRSAKPGFGLRVNHVIFEICELAGIKDLSAKVYKSRNDMNVAKGVVEALTMGQRTLDEVALSRGKKIADLRKVYYSAT